MSPATNRRWACSRRSIALLGAISLLHTSIDPLDLLALVAGNVLLYVVARILLTGILVNTAARSYLGPFGGARAGRTRGLGRELAHPSSATRIVRLKPSEWRCAVLRGASNGRS
jgi:hypothetical protein